MRRRRGFTLIEVLVTIGVIGVLMGLLLPALHKVRAASRRTACASNLRQVGTLLRIYLGEHNDRLPHASLMPSISPAPLLTEKPIFIAKVLKHSTDINDEVFRCPNDEPDEARLPPNAGKSYFETEKSSYEYGRGFFPIGGQTAQDLADRMKERLGRVVADNQVWIMRDYGNFHAPEGKPGSRRYLYVDGHVTDYEN